MLTTGALKLTLVAVAANAPPLELSVACLPPTSLQANVGFDWLKNCLIHAPLEAQPGPVLRLPFAARLPPMFRLATTDAEPSVAELAVSVEAFTATGAAAVPIFPPAGVIAATPPPAFKFDAVMPPLTIELP